MQVGLVGFIILKMSLLERTVAAWDRYREPVSKDPTRSECLEEETRLRQEGTVVSQGCLGLYINKRI